MKKLKPSANNLIIPLMGVNGIHLTNTTLLENLSNADVQYETLKQLITKFKPDGIFAMMDLTVEAQALGLKINLSDNESPSVGEHSVKTLADLEKVKENWKGINGRMGVFIDVIKKLSENSSIINGAYVSGPLTLAGELMGVNELMMNTILEPDLVKDFLDFAVEVISDYTKALFNAGADVVCVLEPTAMMLSPQVYEEFSLTPFKKIIENVDHKPVILHICGDTTHLVEQMGTSGAMGLSLDSQVNMVDTLEKIPENVFLIGNLNPVDVFLNCTPEEVVEATKTLKDATKDYNNFILSSGCDLPIVTSDENLEAFMSAARSEVID